MMLVIMKNYDLFMNQFGVHPVVFMCFRKDLVGHCDGLFSIHV